MEENFKGIKKHFSKLGWIYLAGTLVIFGAQFLGAGVLALCGAIARQSGSTWTPGATANLLSQLIPLYLIGMPVLILLLKRLPSMAPEKHKVTFGQFSASAVMCYSLMIACNIIGLLLTTVIGLIKGGAVNNVMVDLLSGSDNMLLLFIYMVLLAPVFEEYIFRKLLVDSTLRYGKGAAILLSGLIFGLFHGNLNQFAYAFALGVFFAFLYIETGNIKFTIGLHMFLNFMGSTVGMLILRLLPIEEMNAATQSGDVNAVLAMMQEHMAAWLIYLLYAGVIFALIIAGIVLWCVNGGKMVKAMKKNVPVLPENELPKGKRFQTIILNPGMLLYCIFWLAQMVIQLIWL